MGSNLVRLLVLIALTTALPGCGKREMLQNSANMEPTIMAGDVVRVDMSPFAGSGPARWDVIVFEPPIGEGRWLSRVVGLPGETVEIRSGDLFIDGKLQKLPARLSIGKYQLPKTDLPLDFPGPVSFPHKIPEGGYFVLGDNVSDSLDSRYWGSLEGFNIIGKVPGK